MEIFDFPFHTWTTKYPQSSAKVQFGRGYEFASAPRGPDQVTYILHFNTMCYFVASNGAVDLTKNPKINIAKLEQFYNTHRLYEKFIYPNPAKGNLVVRFAKPLEFKLKEGGLGTVDPFTLEFVTQP